jgi:putative ABC transport system substrate-binding protein
MQLLIQTFAAIVATLLVAVPFAAKAQTVHTVGVLMPQSLEQNPVYLAFLETLNLLGYQEGANLRILSRSANGKLNLLPALARELVEARPDVIVGVNTPGARAAIQATKEIPIVITATGDPVGSGFVSNLARPGGNVTGISNLVAELAPKRLALLKEVVPDANRIAVLFNPDDPITVPQVRDAKSAAPQLKVEIRFFPVRTKGELTEAFAQLLAWRAQAALWLLGQQHAFQTGSIELAARHRLPLMVGLRQNVETGGLISYSADSADIYRRTAVYVDRILKGARPGNLPVEQPTKFEMTINLKTANALGLAIPPSVLLQADHVIE